MDALARVSSFDHHNDKSGGTKRIQSKIFSGSMELSAMKKVELAAGISKELIPLNLPDLTSINKASSKDIQKLTVKELNT